MFVAQRTATSVVVLFTTIIYTLCMLLQVFTLYSTVFLFPSRNAPAPYHLSPVKAVTAAPGLWVINLRLLDMPRGHGEGAQKEHGTPQRQLVHLNAAHNLVNEGSGDYALWVACDRDRDERVLGWGLEEMKRLRRLSTARMIRAQGVEKGSVPRERLGSGTLLP